MRRKVIQLAQKTLVVSLPAKWAKRYDVVKGAELEVEERGQRLILSTSSTSSSERITIDASSMNVQVLERWMLSSVYKTGYDEIEITYADSKALQVIQNAILDRLIGFAIVEQTKNRVVLRLIAKEQDKEFEAVLRRGFLVTKNMGEGIIEYISNNEYKKLYELVALEKSNNQLTNFCERMLNKQGYTEDTKTSFIYVICWNLEKICDLWKEIAVYLSKNKKINSKTVALMKQAHEFFNDFYSLFYTFDVDELSTLHKKADVFMNTYKLQLSTGSQADEYVRAVLRDFVIKVTDFSASFISVRFKTS